MSNKIQDAIIHVGDLFFNGVKCSCPIITIKDTGCIDANCTYDEKKKIIEVQIPENCDNQCISFWVECKENDCIGKKLITRCLCDDNGDCGECETCINGICVEDCPKELCLNDTCVDCTEDSQCPCNQKCVQGKCVCDPGTKTCPSDPDCCVECCNSDDCEDCEVCIGGTCTPKDCGEGECVTVDGEDCCAECATNFHCKKEDPNSCCFNSGTCEATCECCEGFVYDSCKEKCVPIPPNSCSTEIDCGLCQSCDNIDPCTGLGVCRAIQCPFGYVLAFIDGQCRCVPECDCDDPTSCDSNRDLCTSQFILEPNKCGCINCGDSCITGCLDGCICDGNDNCVPPCCSGFCENAGDCDDDVNCGCGCLDNTCVECDLLSCANNDCDEALGCVCINGRCTKTPGCTGNCVDANDCALGCTCYEGKCVSCDSFPCEPDDCSNKQNCGCIGGECGPDQDDCNDSLSIIKNEDCTLTGKLEMDSCCNCPAITVAIQPTFSDGALLFDFTLLKGETENLGNRLTNRASDGGNSTIADNDAPATGSIGYSVTNYVLNSDGVTTSQEVEGTHNNTTSSGSGGATGNGTFNNNNYQSDRGKENGLDTISQSGQTTTFSSNNDLVQKEISVNINSVINFAKGTKCKYGKGGEELLKIVVTSDSDLSELDTQYVTLRSDSCRPPLFTWTSSGNIFRKRYVDGNGVYIDGPLGKDDGLEPCKDIDLTVDCGCDRSASSDTYPCDYLDREVSITQGENCKGNWDASLSLNCELFEDLTLEIQSPNGTTSNTGSVTSQGTSELPITILTQVICPEIGAQCVESESLDKPSTNIPLPQPECQGEITTYDLSFIAAIDGVLNVSKQSVSLSAGETENITITTACGKQSLTLSSSPNCQSPTVEDNCTEFNNLNDGINLNDNFCN